MVDTAYFLGLTLIFIRLATFFFVTKVFYPSGTPNVVKGAIGIILSFFIVGTIDTSSLLQISNNYSLVTSIVSEVMSGLILGFVINIIFEVVKMAGSLFDMQIGLSMMNVLDPISRTNVTLLSNVTYYFATVIFFLINGHHVLIKAIVGSFDVVPVGQSIIFQNSFNLVLDAFIKYFLIGVRIAIPIVIILLLVDLCMSLISRTVPAINVMILGMPVKIVVGLILFVLSLPIIAKILMYCFDTIPDTISNVLKGIASAPIVLAFAKDDKTEEATPKKLSEARKKGQVPRSKDVGLAVTMLACTLVIIVFSATVVANLKDYMQITLQSQMLQTVDANTIKSLLTDVILKAFISILPITVPIMIVGVAGTIMQTGFLLTGENLKLNFNKLNPISGFKNMFSMKSLADLGKNILVVCIVGYLGYKYIRDNYESILQISNIYLPSLGKEILNLVVSIFFQITIVLIIIAVIDYYIQRRLFNRDMRMSKQEIKEEYKQMEGDPQIKNKIKQKQREMATRRMMSSVADATVVVTNPTHFAVALKYEEGVSEAPKVVAKGADLIALKIKEVAKENDVPIMENKPLARLLYDKVEIEEEIPQDMYEAVAEILAMVLKLKKKI